MYQDFETYKNKVWIDYDIIKYKSIKTYYKLNSTTRMLFNNNKINGNLIWQLKKFSDRSIIDLIKNAPAWWRMLL